MPTLSKDLRSGTGRIEFEIDADEYVAMGRVTAQWAYLEHGIFALTAFIANSAKVNIPDDALNTSFKRRLNALRSLAEQHCSEDEGKRLSTLFGKITNAQKDRNQITHAMWDYDPTSPDKIVASSFRPRHEFETLYDAAKMNSLADRLGEINFALEYPEGWDAAFAERLVEHADESGRVSYFGVTRAILRQWTSEKTQNKT